MVARLGGHPLDVIASGSLQPMLKRHGFTRRGRSWNRNLGDVVHVINLQGSMYNALSGPSYLFHVNLAVCFPKLNELVDLEPMDGFVHYTMGQIRFRLADVTSDKRDFEDFFTQIDRKRPIAAQGAELARVLEAVVVPFFDRMKTLAAAWQEVRKTGRSRLPGDWKLGSPIALAYLAAAGGGDRARATRLLAGRGRDPGAVKRVRKALGLATKAGAAPDSAAGPALIRQEAGSTLRLVFAGCDALNRARDPGREVLRIAQRVSRCGLAPHSYTSRGNLAADIPASHDETDTWLRQKNSPRRLSRIRLMEDWSAHWVPAAALKGRVGAQFRRFGRDNWHVDFSVQMWDHKEAGFPLDRYATLWSELFLRLATALRPLLRPNLTILFASSSYWDLVEDVERGAFLFGWRTWFGPAFVERFGRSFLLGLPDRANAVAGGGVAHQLNLTPGVMVSNKSGKFTNVRAYLRKRKNLRMGWPRLS